MTGHILTISTQKTAMSATKLAPSPPASSRFWQHHHHCPNHRHRAVSRTPTLHIMNISSIERSTQQPSPPPPQLNHQQPPLIAHELIQGNLVRFSNIAPSGRHPPTIVLVHGILGSRRNMQSFARRIVEGFPSWQVLLVDLRCHGDSANLHPTLPPPHNVASAAADVLRLLGALKMFPEVLIGHSFGGKVVMTMAEQFGNGISSSSNGSSTNNTNNSSSTTTRKSLPRPVRVWVLDSLPGEVRSGEMGRTDRPADLITTLQQYPLPVESRSTLVTQLERRGFSPAVANWAATNLVPSTARGSSTSSGYVWGFDLKGIASMYRSYETSSLWEFLEGPAEGIKVDFVRAERSTFRWGGGDGERILALGHRVHMLRDSGHWVHTDNPDGLFDILAPSFGGQPDLHMQRRL